MKKGYAGFSGDSLQIKSKRGSKTSNEDAMPVKDFEISFSFKTSSKTTALFSIDDPKQGGHDRHIYLKNGMIYVRVWPGKTYIAGKGNYADNQWHSYTLTCETGTNCVSMIDGKKGAAAPIDHSNFDWASRILVGYSADMRAYSFTGQMKDIVYKSTKYSESKSVDVNSAADFVK